MQRKVVVHKGITDYERIMICKFNLSLQLLNVQVVVNKVST